MSPESAKRAGNEIYRAMSDYVDMPEPPSVHDMVGLPASDTLFDLSPTDMVQHYVVAHSDGNLGEFDADSYRGGVLEKTLFEVLVRAQSFQARFQAL